jgi:hypothetical protein
LEKKSTEQFLTGSRGWRGEGAQTMYTHVSKCKNDKIKERKKRSKEKIESTCKKTVSIYKIHL